jgi:two-component system chemotaxis response regulator CheB
MKIRTLIVDDSEVYRKLVSTIAEGFDEIEVVGTAPNGKIGCEKIGRFDVDLVFLDVHMPEMNGVQTLETIREMYPHVLVVMMSSVSGRNAEVTVQALEKGAVDFIRKPDTGDKEENAHKLSQDIASILRLVRVRLQTTKVTRGEVRREKKAPEGAEAPAPVTPVQYAPVPKTVSVIGIGVSTGGPEALKRFIPLLPASLQVPVLLVQHMPPHFTTSLAESLDRISPCTVVEAAQDMPVESGHIYIAPGGRHMSVKKKEGDRIITHINDSPPVNSCRPSVDVLFRSMAAVYENQGMLAVILTGMGNDGMAGVRAMKRKGCICITQSADSCVVYGMPRAVDEEGLSDVSLPLDDIPQEICRRIGICR